MAYAGTIALPRNDYLDNVVNNLNDLGQKVDTSYDRLSIAGQKVGAFYDRLNIAATDVLDYMVHDVPESFQAAVNPFKRAKEADSTLGKVLAYTGGAVAVGSSLAAAVGGFIAGGPLGAMVLGGATYATIVGTRTGLRTAANTINHGMTKAAKNELAAGNEDRAKAAGYIGVTASTMGYAASSLAMSGFDLDLTTSALIVSGASKLVEVATNGNNGWGPVNKGSKIAGKVATAAMVIGLGKTLYDNMDQMLASLGPVHNNSLNDNGQLDEFLSIEYKDDGETWRDSGEIFDHGGFVVQYDPELVIDDDVLLSDQLTNWYLKLDPNHDGVFRVVDQSDPGDNYFQYDGDYLEGTFKDGVAIIKFDHDNQMDDSGFLGFGLPGKNVSEAQDRFAHIAYGRTSDDGYSGLALTPHLDSYLRLRDVEAVVDNDKVIGFNVTSTRPSVGNEEVFNVITVAQTIDDVELNSTDLSNPLIEKYVLDHNFRNDTLTFEEGSNTATTFVELLNTVDIEADQVTVSDQYLHSLVKFEGTGINPNVITDYTHYTGIAPQWVDIAAAQAHPPVPGHDLYSEAPFNVDMFPGFEKGVQDHFPGFKFWADVKEYADVKEFVHLADLDSYNDDKMDLIYFRVDRGEAEQTDWKVSISIPDQGKDNLRDLAPGLLPEGYFELTHVPGTNFWEGYYELDHLNCVFDKLEIYNLKDLHQQVDPIVIAGRTNPSDHPSLDELFHLYSAGRPGGRIIPKFVPKIGEVPEKITTWSVYGALEGNQWICPDGISMEDDANCINFHWANVYPFDIEDGAAKPNTYVPSVDNVIDWTGIVQSDKHIYLIDLEPTILEHPGNFNRYTWSLVTRESQLHTWIHNQFKEHEWAQWEIIDDVP